MATNNFLPFAIGGSANVESQAAYAVDPALTNGQQPGIASSALNNKAIRQSSVITSQLAQYIANSTGLDMLDNTNVSNILTAIGLAFVPAANVISKTGSYTAVINDYVVGTAASAWTLTLPTAVGVKGRSVTATRTDLALANPITVNTTSSQTIAINGANPTSVQINTPGELYVFTSDGANWIVSEHSANTNWQASAPISLSAVTTPPTKATTTQADSVIWRRIGTNAEVKYTYAAAVATGATNGSGDFLVNLPSGISANTTVLTAATTAGTLLGVNGLSTSAFPATGYFTTQNGAGAYAIVIAGSLYTTTSFRLQNQQSLTTNPFWGSAALGIATVNTGFTFTVSLPIANWQA